MFAAVRCALGSRAGVRSQLHASSPLSIEIPCSFACRAVESSIESPQSSRRVGLRVLTRLKFESVTIQIIPMPPVAREAEGGDDEAARDGAFWRPQNP